MLKPLFGAQGKGLRLIRKPDDLPAPDEVAGVYYLQRFEAVEGEGFRDYRLFVVRGRVIAAMMRRAATWITNVKQGGEPWRVGRDARLERSRSRPRRRSGRRSPASTSSSSADGGPTRARGQQHAGVERPAEGRAGRHRRRDRRRADGASSRRVAPEPAL